METIRVNMTPCEDIKTIHASQNDNEAREWGFELHNNGEKIDSSSISDQLVFKAYEGGTEQILPTNGSTPTTSPFKGDIKYPQGLLTDQEFLYRESPTEEDGNAKIKSLYGNTLVWNQLVQNGNFADGTNHWASASGGTISVADGVLTYEVTEVGTSTTSNRFYNQMPLYVYHTYLCIGEFKSTKADTRITARRTTTSNLIFQIDLPNADTWYKASGIAIMNANGGNLSITYNNASSIGAVGDKIYARNIMLIDLTLLGQEFTADQFASLFPLPYYAYNQGTLLSFMGNGIKTTNKNLLPLPTAETKNGITLTHNSDGSITLKGTATAHTYFDFFTDFNSTLYAGFLFTFETSQTPILDVTCRISKSNRVAIQNFRVNTETAVQNEGDGLYLALRIANGTAMPTDGYTLYPMLRMPSQDSTFEAYREPSTLSLPISTYFPTGMKSTGTVYDELTPTKAITRIGAVDLGSLNWNYNSSSAYFTTNDISSLYKVPSSNLTVANIIDPKHTSISANDLVSGGQLGIAIRSNGTLMVKDTNYTDAATFKTAMSGVYLYYELATESETSFTTASLVTENTEIPLSNEDGVLIGKCTEQLSSESGFFDAKIKLADEDGECYSNKIQLHIERSPQ